MKQLLPLCVVCVCVCVFVCRRGSRIFQQGGPEIRKSRRPLFQLTNTDKVILEALYLVYWYLQAGTILERGHAHVTSLVRYQHYPFSSYARAQFFGHFHQWEVKPLAPISISWFHNLASGNLSIIMYVIMNQNARIQLKNSASEIERTPPSDSL